MLKLYAKGGWIKIRQSGSHMIVKKGKHTECIPKHKELKKGTEQDLLKILKKTK